METPIGTRLILASENLLESFGTRTEKGELITAEWGEPDENGWYTPTFTSHADDVIGGTTQDVLRELQAIVGPPSTGTHSCWATSKLAKTRDMLDKAIAEAPDSPRGPEAALLLEAYDDVAPDSRHKISGDYGDLPPGGPIYVDDDEWDEMPESEKRAVAAPDTLSEKPGLDVERLRRSLEWAMRYIDPQAVTLTNQPGDPFTTGYIEAINTLTSTDSEGR